MAFAVRSVSFLCVPLSLLFPPASFTTTLPFTCANGSYDHEGTKCCFCAAGQRLKSHCVKDADNGICELCEKGTYNSYPNAQQSCEPCKSCEDPNAGLEVDEPCTPARNTKCRCKKGHYCSSGKESCKLCQTCSECVTEGVKVACTATNDTVCNDKTAGGNDGIIAAAVAVPVVIIILIIIAAVLLCWRRRKLCWQYSTSDQANGNVADVEMQPLNDLQPHLADVAGALGWRDMRYVAMRSGIPEQAIESCRMNHPADTEEQTLQLLMKFVERQGRDASASLIRILKHGNKRNKADTVSDILRGNL